MAREDNPEGIVKIIEENLEKDAKEDTSEEKSIPLKAENNLNKSSYEEEEIYSWDELEYKSTGRTSSCS